MLAVLGVALLLRIGGITHGVSFHPDERHIVSVTERMLREGDFNPRFFAYGSFPFYIHGGVTLLLKPIWPWLASYDGLFVVGRSIAVVCGVLTVFLTYLLGRLVSGHRAVGVLAALLLALNVFHVQLSRFYTVDIVLATIYVGALLVFCRIAGGGTLRHYLWAGILIGLALATKISALSLLAPLFIAVGIERWQQRDWATLTSYRGVLITLLMAGIFLFIAAPYSFLDYQLFLQHNHEQISMTRGDWRPPYTVQYAHTAPYLYALEQIYRYTFGPILGLTVILGTMWVGWRQFRAPRPLEVLVLAGIVPVFLLVAGLQVKFPRYLLPLYPLLCLCGALALWALGDRLARLARTARRAATARLIPTVLVVSAAAVYVLAFVGIYRQPHSYVTASEWIFENVPRGARLLGVHWDDKLPISLPGLSPHGYRYQYEGPEHELVVYEPESPLKFERMVSQLADHDFIVFPTARTYGSIPLLPEEYSDTTRLFSALFRGELGYGLVQSVKVRPTVAGLVFNDDLADESFSVYDHPKVLIFKNVARLGRDEIARRIKVEGSEAPLLTREAMLLQDGPTDITVTRFPSSWFALAVWFLALELAALVVAPFLNVLFQAAPDRGLGIAKAVGPLGVALIAWLLTWYTGVPTSGGLIGAILSVGLVSAHLFIRRRWGGWRGWLVCMRPHFKTVEFVFAGVFLLFAALRASAPEIFWGEKPMDFTFLNYFTRLTTLPPEDPWVAGSPMGYYYLGFSLFAALHKLTGIDTAIGFNLAIATIGAWLVAALYSLGAFLTGRRWCGLCVALGVALLSNWEVLKLALWDGRAWNFDLFWASSRVLTSPAITEYPIWSLLFADLHAHVIALPFVVALLFVGVAPLKRIEDRAGRRAFSESVVHGVLLGALFALNTWDFISGCGFSAIIIVFRLALADRGDGWWSGVKQIATDVLVIALTTALIVVPFAVTSVKTEQIHWGWVRGEFATLSQVVRHLGVWWALLLLATARPLYAVVHRVVCGRGLLRMGGVFGAALVPIAFGVAASLADIKGFSWALIGSWAVVAAGASAVIVGDGERVERRILGVLGLAGVYLGVGAEFLFLMDRMNTLFKFYHFVWLALAVSSSGLMCSALVHETPWLRSRWGGEAIGALRGLLLVAAVGSAAFGTIVNLKAMVGFQRVIGPLPTLNGQAYLGRSLRDDAPLIDWLRHNTSDLPVVLEAHGEPYGPYTRIAMHTGLPTVLGWEHHVRQRGASDREVRQRKRDVATMYLTTDIAQALRLMKRYHVSFVVISNLERTTYPGEGLQKFERYRQFFEVVKRNAGGTLYRVVLPPGGVIDGVG